MATGGASPHMPPSQSPAYQDIPGCSINFDRTEDNRLIELGSGGFGIVYRGVYDKLGCGKVAIKRIKKSEYGIKERDLSSLKKEAQTMYQIRHPDILTVFGLVCDRSIERDQLFCIVTEYMDRGSMEDLMDQVVLPWPIKVKMLEEASRGLLYLCTPQADRPYSIIHGDIKAANILIDHHFKAKISDFGTSRLQTITSRSTMKQFQCTVTHAAPELLDIDFSDPNPKADPTESTDIWSFGVTIFQACAEIKPNPEAPDNNDRVPFPARCNDGQIMRMISRDMKPLLTPLQRKKVPDNCPAFLYNLCERCCSVNPVQRPKFYEVHLLLNENYDRHCKHQRNSAMIQLHRNLEEKDPDCVDQTLQDTTTEVYDRNSANMVSNMVSLSDIQMVLPSASSDTQAIGTSSENAEECMILKGEYEQKLQEVNAKLLQLEKTGPGRNTKRYTVQIDKLREDQASFQDKMNKILVMQENTTENLSQISNILQSQQQANVVISQRNQYTYKELVISENYAYLKANMNPNVLIVPLHQSGALHTTDVQLIESFKSKNDKVETILQKADTGGKDVIEKLVKALDDTNQSNVANCLRNSYRMNKLQEHSQLLIDYVRPERVVAILFSAGVLTRDDKEIIRAEVTTSGKVERLLEAVDRGGTDALDEFIDALDRTEQDTLANHLR